MVKTKRFQITFTEENALRLEQLSKNTGLRKSTLFRLMLGGTLRDLRNGNKSESTYLIAAWSSKLVPDMIKGIEVY